MAKEPSPAFQFYPKDFIADEHVAVMSMAERGVYISLLCFCWMQGSIPKDETLAGRLVGATPRDINGAVKTVLTRFLPDPSDPTRLIHKRLEAEREKQKEWRLKSSIGGKQSAAKRQANSKGGSTTLKPPLPNGTNQMSTLQSSVSSLQSSTTTSAPPPVNSYTEYPKMAAALREKFPMTDDLFVMRLVQNVMAEILAGDSSRVDQVTDSLLADAVRECSKKSGRQNSAGLFLTTVPQCVKTWVNQNGNPDRYKLGD